MNMIVKTYIYIIKLYAIKLYCKQNRFIEKFWNSSGFYIHP